MAAGALIAGGAMLWLARVQPGATCVGVVLPAIAVFGLGLGIMVAPLTAAVLGAVPHAQAGIASAVNNAAARLAGLLAGAMLPLVAGLGGLDELASGAFAAGHARAMWIGAGLCAAGAVVSFLTVRSGAELVPAPHPSPLQGCSQRRPAPDLGAGSA